MNEQKNISLFSRLFGGDRPSRAGVRSVAVFALLLAVILLVNVLIGLIPHSATSLDLTEEKQFSVSAQTTAFLKQLKENVTIYVFCAYGELGPTMETFLSRYEAASPYIDVRAVDPIADSALAEKFGLSGEDIFNSGTYVFAIESVRRYQLLDATQFSVYYIDNLGEVPAMEYLYWMSLDQASLYQLAQMYSQYNIDIFAATPYMCSERELTMAIDYVTAPTIPHTYIVRGHGEAEFGSYLQSFLQKAALQFEELNLPSVSAIPSDASSLLIFAPSTDFTSQETDMVLSYMEAGGHVTLVTGPKNVSMPNLMRIAESVGLAPIEGVVHEANANYFDKDNGPTAIKPQINSEHSITKNGAEAGYKLTLPEAHGIKMPEKAAANLSTAALFATSNSAYLVGADGTETEIGYTALGAAVQNTTTGSKFAWFTSQKAFEDETAEKVGINSLYYLATAVFGWQYRDYTPTLQPAGIEIVGTQMETEGLSVYLLGGIFAVLVPLVCLGIGISIRLRRKVR